MDNLLITGGTGTLGNAIVEQLLRSPTPRYNKIIIYSRDEQKQQEMFQRWKDADKNNVLRFFIGDVRDAHRLAMAMRDVQVVIHAAALKIVPIGEYNPFEVVKTNIIGTQNLMDVTLRSPSVKYVIAVSTDKAVSPINLYGATKLTMEKIVMASANIAGMGWPKFGVVRYGNVSGSRGSVIPIFKSQIEAGEPVTVTSKDASRFWITTDRAAEFVLGAVKLLAVTANTENIYLPYMEGYNIIDLVRAIAHGKKYTLKYVGLRPGEKTHEELYTDQEKEKYNLLMPQCSNNILMPVPTLRKHLKKAGLV